MEQHEQQQGRQSLGSLLRRYRQSAGLTQEQLAERAGLSRRGIGDIERGARLVPYAHTIDCLAAGLGLPESEHASLVQAAQAQKAASPHVGRQRRAGPSRPPTPTHNLPQHPNRFIGRYQDRAELSALLRTSKLVTLVGPGGVGKTRLALEVAAEQIGAWRDGVWLVELSFVSADPLVPHAMGAVLGIPQQPGRDVSDHLVDWLRDKHLLLVIDNCEHVLETCGSLVAELLRRCPDVRVLATSREVLAIDGETLHRVDPLAVPGIAVVSADTARESDAVQLFVERASAAAQGFNVTDQNAAAVVEVCRRLDGLPLALELTAARLRVLSVHDVARRLDQRFELLTGGHRDGLARHRTLRALVDWSYDLLDEPERELFEQLSVFTGGWTLDAAEAVCSTSAGTLDALSRLVDKSLIRTEPQPDGSLRYEMLETLREYATERLRSSDRSNETAQAACAVLCGCPVAVVRSRLVGRAHASTTGADCAGLRQLPNERSLADRSR
jgi:predicted ATPase/DNA-binding XRE family transcriptional regulator